jgi:hypothetical protein
MRFGFAILPLVVIACSPPTIVDTGEVISGVVDGDQVYWAALHGNINKVPKRGGPITRLGTSQYVDSLRVARDSLYYVDGLLQTTLMRMPTAGGAAEVVFGPAHAISFDLAAGALFVSSSAGVETSEGHGAIWRIDASGSMTKLFAPEPEWWEIERLVADGNTAFFASSWEHQGLWALPVDGASGAALRQLSDEVIVALTWAGDLLYYSTLSEIKRVPKDGSGPASVIASDFSHDLRVDANGLYWAVAAIEWQNETRVGIPGRIMRLPLGAAPGTAPTALVEERELDARLFGSDGTALYFDDDHALRSVAVQ